MTQRILFLFFTSFLLFCGQSTAQAEFGIKFGGNRSKMSNTLLETKTGAYLGGYLEIPFGEHYSLQPELYYSSLGGRSETTAFSNLNIYYLSVAAINKFYITPKRRFHLAAGLGLDFALGNSFDVRSQSDTFVDISPLDVTISAGLGYEFDFGLVIEGRFRQGTISTDFLGSRDAYEQDGSQINSVVQIGLSYKFKREKYAD